VQRQQKARYRPFLLQNFAHILLVLSCHEALGRARVEITFQLPRQKTRTFLGRLSYLGQDGFSDQGEAGAEGCRGQGCLLQLEQLQAGSSGRGHVGWGANDVRKCQSSLDQRRSGANSGKQAKYGAPVSNTRMMYCFALVDLRLSARQHGTSRRTASSTLGWPLVTGVWGRR
jgi:hypothetical protein